MTLHGDWPRGICRNFGAASAACDRLQSLLRHRPSFRVKIITAASTHRKNNVGMGRGACSVQSLEALVGCFVYIHRSRLVFQNLSEVTISSEIIDSQDDVDDRQRRWRVKYLNGSMTFY